MPNETIEDLSVEQFDQLVGGFIEREDDRIEPATFLQAMAELERRPGANEIELAGRLVNGQVVFDTPSPLPVGANTLYVGGTKVTLRLRAGEERPGPRQ